MIFLYFKKLQVIEQFFSNGNSKQFRRIHNKNSENSFHMLLLLPPEVHPVKSAQYPLQDFLFSYVYVSQINMQFCLILDFNKQQKAGICSLYVVKYINHFLHGIRDCVWPKIFMTLLFLFFNSYFCLGSFQNFPLHLYRPEIYQYRSRCDFKVIILIKLPCLLSIFFSLKMHAFFQCR